MLKLMAPVLAISSIISSILIYVLIYCASEQMNALSEIQIGLKYGRQSVSNQCSAQKLAGDK